MATYKVAQDVEADDKLLGPFSFRQFIYLIIVAMACFMAWGLGQLFIGLVIIPLPIILFFGALALPLRKDQPMETYLAALVSFYIKPRKRLWKPDGVESLVEITAPKVVEVQRTKGLSETEAERRLAYLADIADTRGWSIRHASMPSDNTSMQADIYNEAQQAEDLLDDNATVARSFETMIDQADARRRQAMIERLQHPQPSPAVTAQPTPPPAVIQPAPQSVAQPVFQQAPVAPQQPVAETVDPNVTFNPYPTMHQSVVQPVAADDQTVTAAPPSVAPVAAPQVVDDSVQSTSDTTISPDIINLANNSDLSIETIAHEAERIKKKHDDDEVVISLR